MRRQSSASPLVANRQPKPARYLPLEPDFETLHALPPYQSHGKDRSDNRHEKLYRGPISSLDSKTLESLLKHTLPRSTTEKFNVLVDVSQIYSPMKAGRFRVEDDDELHNPSPRDLENGINFITRRGFANLGCLVSLIFTTLFFFAGFPVLSHFGFFNHLSRLQAARVVGVNATGQVPDLGNFFYMIDPDTPPAAYHHTSLEDNSQWDLIFSDEFNRDNRTFYPGDDPYWEAVDLHYYQTGDLEWYDPVAVTTGSGALQITLSQTSTHGLNYQGAVSLPGLSSVSGLWPAVWTMGNLGRAGYGASTDGMWPYSYDSCDWGTLANQSFNGLPAGTASGGIHNRPLSFLPGQRLSACTCPEEDHPGPKRADGTFVGRSAPEIDVLEAIVNEGIGQVSQSAQWAPFDERYNWKNDSANAVILNPSAGNFNPFRGNVFQESTSGLFRTDQSAYSGFSASPSTVKYSVYGFEYKPGKEGYLSWVSNGVPSWTMKASAVGENEVVNISARPISQEPMYLIMNLGISPSFGEISPSLEFPMTMFVDYIRVYQDPKLKNVGCDPPGFPTHDYISSKIDVYTNQNLTTFAQSGRSFPRNRLIQTCGQS
ncbi:beta-glucan synthesis-associated [Cantharellus anzutake]|uniref:beta-glucan synthesis-associated n=1 Tax=Cantharellus anzutake TaxID=1750568 RepID=UPI0019049FD1|nr:beta-glucan synthesis-associated [Cantharellus anzutake]KAF8338032.1 beta-glucan synthesis-associated [Cantharellus anzutake]